VYSESEAAHAALVRPTTLRGWGARGYIGLRPRSGETSRRSYTRQQTAAAIFIEKLRRVGFQPRLMAPAAMLIAEGRADEATRLVIVWRKGRKFLVPEAEAREGESSVAIGQWIDEAIRRAIDYRARLDAEE
jgi:DNA-binding transcriptional MerR regulator